MSSRAPIESRRLLMQWSGLAVLLAWLASLSLAAGAMAEEASVEIHGMSYMPTPITVQVGDTVTWSNESFLAHTVTAVGGTFDSERISHGASFSFVFNAPGTYLYTCTLHPDMRGEVIVHEGALASPLPTPSPTSATSDAVSVKLSHAAGRHGRHLLIHAHAARPGASVLLELYSREHFSWRQVGHGTLDASGSLTLSLSAHLHRSMRLVVVGPAGASTLISHVVSI